MNIFKDDFHIGQRFKYLDITMLVIKFNDCKRPVANIPVDPIKFATMTVEYVAEGKLVRHTFNDVDHPAVMTELNDHWMHD